MTKRSIGLLPEVANSNEVGNLPASLQSALDWVKGQVHLLVENVRQYKKQKLGVGKTAKIYQFPLVHRESQRVKTTMTIKGRTVAIDGKENVVIPGDVANDVGEEEQLPIAVGQSGGMLGKLGFVKRPDVPKEVKNLVHELLVSKKRPRKIVGDPNTIETPITLTQEQKQLLIQAIELNYLTDEQMVDLRFQLTISPFSMEEFREVHWKAERNRHYLLQQLRK